MAWSDVAPTIVAEALSTVRSPLQTCLRCPPPASPASVARALAQSLAPGESDETPPDWLRPGQLASFRRLAYAVDRFRGAILADPVGTGKTYIALAVARNRCRGFPTVCIVPPALAGQWQRVAQALDIPAVIWSHAKVSRGKLPPSNGPLVIIDESHHFRNRAIRRYEHLAPWITGRRAIFVSATPVVNHLTDVANQLRLAVRDNALVDLGLPSITQVLRYDHAHPALEHLIIRGDDRETLRPHRRDKAVCTHSGSSELEPLLEAVDDLNHSTNPSIQSLMRSVFWRAAASSPAALLGCAKRYQRLLHHARDARASGRAMSRSALHWFTAGAEDQLIFWPLLTDGESATDLDLTDLVKLDTLIPAIRAQAEVPDAKCRALRTVLSDERPTLVFTTSEDTIGYLRRQLNMSNLAWCTGRNSGIGSTPLPRHVVLEWFRPEARRQALHVGRPSVLLSTDVAAEGLDLQAAARVVHYDLPWTAVRLTQRDGRVLRLGSTHRQAEIISFPLPSLLDRRLRQHRILDEKRRLPVRLGLAGQAVESWRWRVELARLLGPGAVAAGCALVSSSPRGFLAGFSVYGHRVAGRKAATDRHGPVRLLSTVLWIRKGPRVTTDPTVITEKLLLAASSSRFPVPPSERRRAMGALAPVIQHRMRKLRRARWAGRRFTHHQHRIIHRLQAFATSAARQRSPERLGVIEHALEFARGGHTAGEQMLVETLARLPDEALMSSLATLPRGDAPLGALEARINGLIIFDGDRANE